MSKSSKTITRYVCQNCGRQSSQQLGKCPSCGQFGTMQEEIISQGPTPLTTTRSTAKKLSEITAQDRERYPMKIEEFARVLGGGIVPDALVLMGGDPGIGKSTLALQMALEMAGYFMGKNGNVLYVSGEESETQVKMRADRLLNNEPPPPNFYLMSETNLNYILEQVRQTDPRILVIDSIQTIYLPELESSAGSVSQVRECAARLCDLAKSRGIAVFVIGHVTKDGNLAGPRVLEHIVDTVLYLEGDRYQSFRLLRTIKNRFGVTSEVGVFEMRDTGLVEVNNPSEMFLAERLENASGSAITVTMEGTRPLLVEIQGLTTYSTLGNPRRTPNGVDMNRLLLVTAVLTRRSGLKLSDQDIFVNVVGGLKVSEPSADLALAAAVASSFKDIPVRPDTVLIGEIGLSGELRWCGQMSARLREACKMGFKRAIIPRKIGRLDLATHGMEIVQARTLKEALKLAFAPADSPAQ